jgi:glycosidase
MEGDGASHPDVRKDFPGGWPGDTLNLFSDAGRKGKVDSVFRFFQRLLTWRKTSSAIHKGSFRQFIPVENQYAYLRKFENEMVLVVVNGNNKPGKFDLSRLNGELSDWKRTEISEVITGQKADLSGKELNLPAKGILIFDFRR